jgi:ATPase subunit of ABC transporter with duplicated ATPase domains
MAMGVALGERGGLLVSHDERFLGHLTRTRWELAEERGVVRLTAR